MLDLSVLEMMNANEDDLNDKDKMQDDINIYQSPSISMDNSDSDAELEARGFQMNAGDAQVNLSKGSNSKEGIKLNNNFNFIQKQKKDFRAFKRLSIFEANEFWTKDELCKSCFKCSSMFTILNRKHHCRMCGKIFCSTCSNVSIDFPKLAKESKSNYVKRVRICVDCFNGVIKPLDDKFNLEKEEYLKKIVDNNSSSSNTDAISLVKKSMNQSLSRSLSREIEADNHLLSDNIIEQSIDLNELSHGSSFDYDLHLNNLTPRIARARSTSLDSPMLTSTTPLSVTRSNSKETYSAKSGTTENVKEMLRAKVLPKYLVQKIFDFVANLQSKLSMTDAKCYRTKRLLPESLLKEFSTTLELPSCRAYLERICFSLARKRFDKIISNPIVNKAMTRSSRIKRRTSLVEELCKGNYDSNMTAIESNGSLDGSEPFHGIVGLDFDFEPAARLVQPTASHERNNFNFDYLSLFDRLSSLSHYYFGNDSDNNLESELVRNQKVEDVDPLKFSENILNGLWISTLPVLVQKCIERLNLNTLLADKFYKGISKVDIHKLIDVICIEDGSISDSAVFDGATVLGKLLDHNMPSRYISHVPAVFISFSIGSSLGDDNLKSLIEGFVGSLVQAKIKIVFLRESNGIPNVKLDLLSDALYVHDITVVLLKCSLDSFHHYSSYAGAKIIKYSEDSLLKIGPPVLLDFFEVKSLPGSDETCVSFRSSAGAKKSIRCLQTVILRGERLPTKYSFLMNSFFHIAQQLINSLFMLSFMHDLGFILNSGMNIFDAISGDKSYDDSQFLVSLLFGFMPQQPTIFAASELNLDQITLRDFVCAKLSSLAIPNFLSVEEAFLIEDIKKSKTYKFSSIVVSKGNWSFWLRFIDADLFPASLSSVTNQLQQCLASFTRKQLFLIANSVRNKEQIIQHIVGGYSRCSVGGLCRTCNAIFPYRQFTMLQEDISVLQFFGFWAAMLESASIDKSQANCRHVNVFDFTYFIEMYGKLILIEPERNLLMSANIKHSDACFQSDAELSSSSALAQYKVDKLSSVRIWLDQIESRNRLSPAMNELKYDLGLFKPGFSFSSLIGWVGKANKALNDTETIHSQSTSPGEEPFVLVDASSTAAYETLFIDLFRKELSFPTFFIGALLKSRAYDEAMKLNGTQGSMQVVSALHELFPQLFSFSNQNPSKEKEKAETIAMKLVVYYPNLFFKLRQSLRNSEERAIEKNEGEYDRLKNEGELTFFESIMLAKPFSSTGGKTNAGFYETRDNKFLLKVVSQSEVDMFRAMSVPYFKHIEEITSNSGSSSCLLKIVGLYTLTFPDGYPAKNTLKTSSFMVMERLQQWTTNYKSSSMSDISIDGFLSERMFDLKGNLRNRYTDKTSSETNSDGSASPPNELDAVKSLATTSKTTLLDVNFFEFFEGHPVTLCSSQEKQALLEAVKFDTLMLQNAGIVDYSLLVSVPYLTNEIYDVDTLRKLKQLEKDNAIRCSVGIVDYVQQYNTRKMVESNVKKATSTLEPTVIDPQSYRTRFIAAVDRYFVAMQ